MIKKGENGNIKLIIIIAIIAILLILGIVFTFKPNKKEPIVPKQEPYEYFVLNSLNGKSGIIDKKGNTIVNAEYENIYIPNQAKDVFICFKDENNYSIINKEGQDIFKEYDSVYAILVSETSLEMEKNVLLYEQNEKFGLIDFSGKKITDAIYDEVESLPNKPGFIRVKKGESYGVIDSVGNTVIDIKYNSVVGDEYSTASGYDKTGYIVSEKTNTGIMYGYINSEGKTVIEPKYESISRALEYDDDDIYLIFMENGKKGVIKNKKVIIKPKYQTISYYNLSNIFVVNRNGRYGFCDNSGEEILPVEYSTYFVAGNYICVKKDDSMMLYDLHGNLVNTNIYKSIIETENPQFFIAQDEKGYYSIISKDFQINNNYKNISYAFNNFFIITTDDDKTGILDVYSGMEVEPAYDSIIVLESARALEARKGNELDVYSEKIEKILTMKDGIVEKVSDKYFTIYSNTEKQYIDDKGNPVSNTDVYENLKLYSYKAENGKWGYKDKEGNVKVEAKYDRVTELNEYGFAGIQIGTKWGVIDEEGNVVLEPKYELETYYEPSFIGKYLLEQQETVYCTEMGEK